MHSNVLCKHVQAALRSDAHLLPWPDIHLQEIDLVNGGGAVDGSARQQGVGGPQTTKDCRAGKEVLLPRHTVCEWGKGGSVGSSSSGCMGKCTLFDA